MYILRLIIVQVLKIPTVHLLVLYSIVYSIRTIFRRVDCSVGTIPEANIYQNRAWITTYINEVSQSNFTIADVQLSPVFNTTAPHTDYPTKLCDEVLDNLFCDDFDSNGREIPEGLSPRFQRNQTDYSHSQPWNVSYITTWNSQTYTSAHFGDGYAVSVITLSSQVIYLYRL